MYALQTNTGESQLRNTLPCPANKYRGITTQKLIDNMSCKQIQTNHNLEIHWSLSRVINVKDLVVLLKMIWREKREWNEKNNQIYIIIIKDLIVLLRCITPCLSCCYSQYSSQFNIIIIKFIIIIILFIIIIILVY